jgi:plastocyanin
LEYDTMPSHVLLRWTIAAAVLAALPPSASAAPNDIGAMMTMTNSFEFEPHAVTIHVGQAVEWRNASRFKHTVTADPKLGSAVLPAGAQPFASQELQPGESFRQVLTVPGKYRFFCTPHEGVGMMGEITVLADK